MIPQGIRQTLQIIRLHQPLRIKFIFHRQDQLVSFCTYLADRLQELPSGFPILNHGIADFIPFIRQIKERKLFPDHRLWFFDILFQINRRFTLFQKILQSPEYYLLIQIIISHTCRAAILTWTAADHFDCTRQNLRNQIIDLFRITKPSLVFVINKKRNLFFPEFIRNGRIIGHCHINIVTLRHCHHHRRVFDCILHSVEMIVQHQLSHAVRLQKTTVNFNNILRHRDPGTFRIIIFLKWLRQCYISKILMVMEL